jgi:hypothetical protein
MCYHFTAYIKGVLAKNFLRACLVTHVTAPDEVTSGWLRRVAVIHHVNAAAWRRKPRRHE